MSRELFRKQLAQLRPYVAGKPVEQVRRDYRTGTYREAGFQREPVR